MGQKPFQAVLYPLLEHDHVLGHELVYGELLIGDRGMRRRLLADYAMLSFAPTIAHEEVVALVRGRQLAGRGMGWIDAQLLASALAVNARLYTADGPFARLARELGVLYSEEAST